MSDPAGTADATPRTRIWDLPLRLFHWLLVLTLCGSWLTQELGTAWMDWHVRLGYFALGLVVFRILWGFVGPRHARFSSFLPPYSSLRALRSGDRNEPSSI